MLFIDFETEPIVGSDPPKPVGVAWARDSGPPRYAHWGHRRHGALPGVGDAPWRSGSISEDAARTLVRDLFAEPDLCFFNASFDVRVAYSFAGIEAPYPVVHDVQWLAWLYDPTVQSLALKSLAEHLLGEPPEERNRLREWIRENVPGCPRTETGWAEMMAYAPARLVSTYARGDVTRTRSLYRWLRPRVSAMRMDDAYERERRVFPVLLRMQDRGFEVDMERLAIYAEELEHDLRLAERWLAAPTRLGGANPRSPDQLRAQLLRSGVMDEEIWDRYRTRTGELSTSSHALQRAMRDRKFANVLGWQRRASTLLGTFVRPWLEAGPTIRPAWRQVKARTGRLSSTPNVQNIPSSSLPLVTRAGDEGLLVPRSLSRLSIPAVRSVVVPRLGCIFVDADYSQQELRILAHYVGGDLSAAYRVNPQLDLHDYVRLRVAEATGRDWPRKLIKNVNFGILYGSGAAKQADQLGLDATDEDVIVSMRALKRAVLEAVPGIARFESDLRDNPARHVRPGYAEAEPVATGWTRRPQTWDPLYTIGGRVVFLESALCDEDGDVLQSFEYKMLNTVVQGSAGDQLKEALYALDAEGYEPVLSVHDQIVVELPVASKRALAAEAKRISQIMVEATEPLRRPTQEGVVRFDIPMIAEPAILERWE